MTIDTVGQFIAELERAGELKRISQPVSVDLELCEIADRVMKMPGGGPALLFENVTLFDGSRSAYPVAINLFGSMRRMSMSLGVERLDEIGERIAQMMELKVPEGLVVPDVTLVRRHLGQLPGEEDPDHLVRVAGRGVHVHQQVQPIVAPITG